ncbi:hypothetical protein LOTGIDRAFT_157400 [Lottia gigantea]|uniref:Nerve growth factor-related domain-containing protein n=1 Tax=Lottia gigantea TaxID=225164 RepID=V4CGL3_LOTGI|nr:hypothetical protein LOTGIDRAFT_157400 [Lottia gigantea]ESP01230.1 hypothetical protein LOTGIDRAFT_157400 [Lottia gigantea]
MVVCWNTAHEETMRMYLYLGILLIILMPNVIRAQLSKKDKMRNRMLTELLRVERKKELRIGECCPSITEKIHPRGGLSRNNELLELYRDHKTIQAFYQTKCLPGVAKNTCQFLDKKYQAISRCVQKYTYMYAIVRDFNISQPYRVDYIRIKTGCSCELVTDLEEFS